MKIVRDLVSVDLLLKEINDLLVDNYVLCLNFRNFKRKQLHRREKTVNYHSDTLSGSEMENSPKSISKHIRIESCENHSK